MFEQFRLGKWLIGIGLTFGSLALIIWVISAIVNGTGIITDPLILGYLSRLKGFFTYNTGLQFIGVTTALVGRKIIKKPKEIEEENEEHPGISEEAESGEPTLENPSENKYCPKCGTQLPIHANFCNDCGSTFSN